MLARSGTCLLQWVSKPARDSQTVWSQWVRLGAGNAPEAESITKTAISTGSTRRRSSLLPRQGLAEGEERGAREKDVAGQERCLMIEGEHEG